MKNLKKLNRNELKTINGGNWLSTLETVINVVGELEPIVLPLITPALCNVQCTVNGVVQIKLLACGSTC